MSTQSTLNSQGEEVCLPKKEPVWRKWLILAIALAAYFGLRMITFPGLTELGQNALAFTIAFVILLTFEVFPIIITCIFAVIVPPLCGLITEADAYANSTSGPIFFCVGVLTIAAAFQTTGFSYRISLYVSGLFGSKPSRVLLAYMLGAGIVSSVLADIPTAIIFAAIASDLLKKNGCYPGCSNFGRALMCGIPIAATVGGIGTPAGGILNVMTISILANVGIEISFLKWTLICFPFAIVMLLMCWAVLCKVYPAEIDQVKGLEDLEIAKKDLGPMSAAEKKYLLIFALMIILWLTQPLTGISLWLTSIIGAALLFMPGIDIITWSEARKHIDPSLLFLVAATNVLAFILTQHGTSAWLANNTVGALNTTSIILIMLVIVAVGVYGHFVIPSQTAVIAVLTPIFVMLAPQFNIPEAMIAIALCAASRVSTLLPFADTLCLATYDHGYWTSWDMIKPSLVYGTIWIPLSVLYFYLFYIIGFFG